MTFYLLWISDDPEYDNVAILNFPPSWKTEQFAIWEISMTMTSVSKHNSAFFWLKLFQLYYKYLLIKISLLVKYPIIKKMSNMKGLFKVPL